MKKDPGQQSREDFELRQAELLKIARREVELYIESLHLDDMSAEEKVLRLYFEKQLAEKEMEAYLKGLQAKG